MTFFRLTRRRTMLHCAPSIPQNGCDTYSPCRKVGEIGAGRKLLGEKFPVNDVAAINIRQEKDELNLVKKDEVWRVRERGDYAASFSEISGFLLKAADLKVVQNEDIGVCEEVQRNLNSRSYTTGRFSVKRENGGYYFHQVLWRVLKRQGSVQ